MSCTGISYGTASCLQTSCAVFGSEIGPVATRMRRFQYRKISRLLRTWLQVTCAIVLRLCYAMPSADMVGGANCFGACYAMPGIDISYRSKSPECRSGADEFDP
eukprot:1696463-Rhodomonas_salina.5